MKIKGFLIFMILLLSSCRNNFNSSITKTVLKVNIGDGGLLSQNPCGPPCFYGMKPDITTIDQAQTILNNMGMEGYCTIFGNLSKPGIKGLDCKNIVTICIKDSGNNIKYIYYLPSIPIVVGEIIDKYGNPNLVSIADMNIMALPMKLQMNIYYNTMKMKIILEQKDGDKYQIEYSTKITSIEYDDGEYYYYHILYNTKEWHGYGEYL